jgi:hypothetical protein
VTIFGWDLSHYDLSTIGDAVDEGFSFFTHKAGGDANDTEIATWWSGVKSIPPTKALLGAYWVLYPGSASSRADQFLARLDATCPGWRNRPFMLQVDCEEWSGDSGTVPSKSDIKTFCDRLVAKMPKLRPIVYGPNWVYHDSLAGLGYPLWASAYSTASSGTASGIYAGIGGDGSSKWGSYSGQVPKVLQFTSSATIAGQTTCDANAFRGTLAELTALVAPGWAEEMAVQLNDDDKAWMLANLGPAATWKADNIIPAPAGSLNSDGTPNLFWAGSSYVQNIYGKVNAIRTAQALVPTVADIVAGVVAALPPASTGGPTLDQIQAAAEAGVNAAFASAFDGAGGLMLEQPRGQHGVMDDGSTPSQ